MSVPLSSDWYDSSWHLVIVQTSNFSFTELYTYLGRPKCYKFDGWFRRRTYLVGLNSRKIERMQERGLRAVFRNNVSYPELLKRAELPSLQNRRLQDICVLMYKAKNNLCPPYISDIFIEHRSKYNLRQSDFSAARYNTVTYGKHSLRHLGPNLWGKLSPDLREVTTLKCFKNKIQSNPAISKSQGKWTKVRNSGVSK